ncbi:hypothetical protein [Pedobacter sp. MR2016-24]|uniref:hypothetical protein n=1 Tax=Pedobacter sp. MR2016-24 TaxID=2994466 RepID=UPI00224571BC|nr:hypothetical protein [Pedobacter sp. MR2016-24]MCX2484957.1 hypothetical protein [Pedobacter sp. MR2016-24]
MLNLIIYYKYRRWSANDQHQTTDKPWQYKLYQPLPVHIPVDRYSTGQIYGAAEGYG